MKTIDEVIQCNKIELRTCLFPVLFSNFLRRNNKHKAQNEF